MVFRFGEYEVDVDLGELRRKGIPVLIQAKPFLLLVYLVRQRDRVVSKDELLAELWHGTVVGEAAIRRALRIVRKAIGDDGRAQSRLRTFRGRGYRFVAEVDVVSAQASDSPPLDMPGQQESFIGRVRLLERSSRALVQARNAEGQLLLYSGEPGIGKTALLREVARRAAETGFEVYQGQCVEREGPPPYRPWRQVLRRMIEQRGMDAIVEVLGPATEDLLLIDPQLAGTHTEPTGASPFVDEEAVFCLTDSFARLLRSFAAERPLLIGLEDLHYSDLDSLNLLHQLAIECRDVPLVILGTYRSFELKHAPQRSRALGKIERARSGANHPLNTLGREEIADLVYSLIGMPLSDQLLDEMSQRSGGNPFFVTVLSQSLSENRGELSFASLDSDRARPVVDMIWHQLANRSQGVLETLGLAALAGREFSQGLLLLAGDGQSGELASQLSDALDAGVIREVPHRPGHYSFVHALVAESLGQTLGDEERIEKHASLATALEQLPDSELPDRLPVLAAHYLKAGPEFWLKAITSSRQAAYYALSVASPEEAVLHLERALIVLRDRVGEGGQLCDVSIELGEARTKANDTVGARASLADAALIARSIKDPIRLARAAIAYSNEVMIGTYQPESVNLLEEALAMMPEAGPGAENLGLVAMLKSSLANSLKGTDPFEDVARLAREAIGIARESGDSLALAVTLADGHFCLMGVASPSERLVLATELAVAARAVGARDLEQWAAIARVEDFLEMGDTRRITSACRSQERLAEKYRQPFFLAYSLQHRAMQALRAGRLGEVEGNSTQALELGLRSGNRFFIETHGAQLWGLRREQGRLEEVDDFWVGLTFRDAKYEREACLIMCALARGEVVGARRRFEVFVDDDLAFSRRSINWLSAPALLAEVGAQLGDVYRSRLLYEELAPHGEKNAILGSSMVDLGPVQRFLGVCAATYDPNLAQRHLERAVFVAERDGLGPVSVRARLDLARTLRTGDRERSVAEATKATDQARELGMQGVLRGAEGLLR